MSKINNNKTSGFDPIQALRQSEVKSTGKSESHQVTNQTAIGKDKLEFSASAAQTGKFLEQLKNLPDVRQEKIDSLRRQISSGDYNPSSDAIADAILNDEQNG